MLRATDIESEGERLLDIQTTLLYDVGVAKIVNPKAETPGKM